jgi:hypothetical protein
MPESSTNNELVTDASDESDVLKIDTFDKLDELLHTAGKRDLAAIRQFNFIYNVDDDHLDRGLELQTARFLGALPQLQILQLDQTVPWQLPTSKAMSQLLQRAITEASATSFRELKTIIWGLYKNTLDEMLPLWGFPVEHIEVSVREPVAWPYRPWPAPNPSLKRLNLHSSTIQENTLEKLLHLSPCLEVLRHVHSCNVSAVSSEWSQDGSILTAALRQVQSTLRELDLSVYLYSTYALEVEDIDYIIPVSGQLGPLREFSCLCKLKAPIATLLGWSPDKLFPLAEVVPTGLTYLGLTEDLLTQYTSEWHEEFVVKELAAFLSVWRSVTPDLQVLEVWLKLARWWDEDEELEEMTQMRKMCEEAQESGLSFIVHHRRDTHSQMTFQWARCRNLP